jgi:hypothetical protein
MTEEQDPAARADATVRPAALADEKARDADATIISSSPAYEPTTRRVATLVVVQGSDIGRHYPLRRHRVVLGRADAADIVLKDREISRAHAVIESVQLGGEAIYRLSDQASTNHVFVNGRGPRRTCWPTATRSRSAASSSSSSSTTRSTRASTPRSGTGSSTTTSPAC